MKLLVALVMLWLVSCASMYASDYEQRRAEMQRQFDQRRAEMQRKFDQRRAEMMKNFQGHNTSSFGGSSASTVKTYGSTPAPTVKSAPTVKTYGAAPQPATSTPTRASVPPVSSPSDRMLGTAFNPLPFDAAHAPSPDLCFLKFVQTALAAKSADEIMNFLPFAQQRTLKECQAQYDPAAAAQRKAEYQKNSPSMPGSSIEHLTESPYAGELKSAKRIAAKVIRVRKVTIKGNTAELDLSVHSDAESNAYGKWQKFPYSTATVEMLGEGDYWRFKSYNDHNISYTEPQ